jgi:hypothetical protein
VVWIAVSTLGFAVETSLIIALGRGVTGPYERATDPERTDTTVVRRP